ncbi:MAG: methyltransferase domain-containing protein [Acidobacteria bacterium]|nr:methyltransferase domain-containing protein [Acidobacteriota bacterium]
MARKATTLDTEMIVRERYEKAARAREAQLCCPITYDPKYLEAIPQEILDKDYGCGDPSRYVRQGDTVLDLGSGGGKICYIAAQIAGPKGRVIGVDFNPEMLALARKYRDDVAAAIGWSNVAFHRGRIQDLALPLDEVDAYLKANPVRSSEDLRRFEEFETRLRQGAPMIPDGSVDVILSNCVLNLVREEDREQLFREMFRVLKRGGRVAISDIVSDEPAPETMKRDAELWSGCIAGAFQETAFLAAFERAGFHAITLDKYDEKPWKTIRGIEFRSVTLTARKGKQGPCLERKQAVIYKGPWRKVEDDDGHTFVRGQRMAVCDKTYRILTSEPYTADVIAVPPIKEVPLQKAKPFACGQNALRAPAETKGRRYRKTLNAAATCAPGSGCC